MREAWTDGRLDDLNQKVDEGFRKVDKRFDRLEDEMDARFHRIDLTFERLEERLEARFDSLNRMLFLFSGSMIVALFGVIAAVA